MDVWWVAFNMVILGSRFLLVCHLANFSTYLQSHYRWGKKRVGKHICFLATSAWK